MGSNQTSAFLRKSLYVKAKKPELGSVRALSQLLKKSQRRTFSGRYGNLLDLAEIEVSTRAIEALAQFYDPPLRCFTFQDFQLSPTLEEFERIVGCPLVDGRVYLYSGHFPALAKVAFVLKVQEQELVSKKQSRNRIDGFPTAYLEERARSLAKAEDWDGFMDVLALVLYGIVLFPNFDGFVTFAAIDAFLAFKHRGESPVVAILADVYYTFNFSYEKKGTRILCCSPALYVWMVTRVFSHGCRTPCPIEDFKMCHVKNDVEWGPYLANLSGRTVRWYLKWSEVEEVIWQCGDFPNVPLMGTRGCTNYNPTLALRQFGYPIHEPPSDDAIAPLVLYNLGPENMEMLKRIRQAWGKIVKKGKELRKGSCNTKQSYNQWLMSRVQEIKLPFYSANPVVEEMEEDPPMDSEEVKQLKAALEKIGAEKSMLQEEMKEIRKECERLQCENVAKSQSLEAMTEKARVEEESRQKFQSSLKGASNELRLRGQERNQALTENRRLKGLLKDTRDAQKGAQEQLEEVKHEMQRIIEEYEERIVKERQKLAAAYQGALREEQATVRDRERKLEEKDAVVQTLYDEGTLWMHRFATTLRGGQDLPRLLARAQLTADPFSTPEETHDLFDYCDHVIELMKKIIRHR